MTCFSTTGGELRWWMNGWKGGIVANFVFIEDFVGWIGLVGWY
jgi:hypothetical protein